MEYDHLVDNEYLAPEEDVAGADIINPMEGAEFYQGYQREDDNLAEYRS